MDSPSSQPGWSRLEALLDQALELPIDQRGTLLERVGREDPALRERVEQLLAADAAAGDFLNDGAKAWLHSGATTPAHHTEESALAPGDRVDGKYELLRTLGRRALKPQSLSPPSRDLTRTETTVLALLRRRLHQDDRRTA